MDDKQIELLFRASQHPMLTAAQREQLQLRNPYALSGPVAEVMQSAVAELDPVQARAWMQEAGATMSLQAAAAMRGLAQMTPQLQAEIQRFNPLTVEEQQAQRIAELTATNPYGKAGYYTEDGDFVPPTGGNLTQAMELEALNSQLAAKLKAEATPAASNGGMSAEDVNFVMQEMHRSRLESQQIAFAHPDF